VEEKQHDNVDLTGPDTDLTEPDIGLETLVIEDEVKPKKKKFDLAFELYDWAHSLVFAFVGFVLILSFAAGIFSVSQTSMTDTLQPGEMVIVSRLPYTPKKGDIVLFVKHGWMSSYNHDTGLYNPLIKRIVGLPGDELVYDSAEETLYINGDPVDEPFIKGQMLRWADERLMEEGKVIVPEGNIFVMGDNRGGSHDSRNADIGFVDTRSILGPAVLRVSPFSKFGRI
jgi:signal peptidase I